MKKAIALALVGAMSVGLLAGCGGGSSSSAAASSAASTEAVSDASSRAEPAGAAVSTRVAITVIIF